MLAKNTYISGIPNISARAEYFVHDIFSQQKHGYFLWIVKNSEEQQSLAPLIRFWIDYYKLSLPILSQPDWSSFVKWNRSESAICILTLEDCTRNSLPALIELHDFTMTLRKAESRSLTEVVKQCSVWGYELNTTANAPGIMAKRGAIFDIYLESLIRIEWNANTIESISDPATKKSFESIEIPAHTISSTDLHASWIDYLSHSKKNLQNTLNIILSDEEEFSEYDNWKIIKNAIDDFSKIIFRTFPSSAQQERVLQYDSPPSFHHNMRDAKEVVFGMLQSKFKVFVASFDHEKIEKLFGNHADLHIVEWHHAFESWLNTKKKILFLTDIEIFGGLQKTSTKKISPKDLDWLHELTYGDYVVHTDHGIARFRGMSNAEVEGVMKEYFTLEYASNDKLMVPVDMAHKLDKYIGDPHPKLERLSGSAWFHMTEKIRRDTLKVAHDLLKLYAERNLCVAPQCDSAITEEEENFASSFVFNETPDQKRAIIETLNDLETDTPTDRLICGDVGFGKTEVALRAAARMAFNGFQVALLAPTTILSQQHFDTFSKRLSMFPVKIAMLTRFQSKKEQQKIVASIQFGAVDIVIGTHRLLQKDIAFKNLGLIIVDEEQRFGVKDKERLKTMKTNAHILTLTATPIPRTLSMALSGIREISFITTAPEGRIPITTVISPYEETLIQNAVHRELKRQGQVYYLYNHVESIEMAKKFLQKLIPEAKIDIAHGQMNEKDLAHAMQKFDKGETNVLVCSTIIENGLDLPNANTLIVDHATNFGLSQLYQLRGRVGRSDRQAYAYFLYHRQKLSGEAKKRLLALKQAQALGSGWQIAKRDLEIRGAGEILGHNQHGRVSSIGLNLYLRLLDQAVTELKTGKPIASVRDVSIDLPVSYGIPKILVHSESERLHLYQTLSQISSLHELKERGNELLSRISAPRDHEYFECFLTLLRWKLLCQDTNILNIDTVYASPEKRAKIVFTFMGELDFSIISRLLRHNSAWQWKKHKLMIYKDELGKEWIRELEKIIEGFRR